MFSEYLLDKTNSRLTVHPIKENDIWSFYKKMMATYWTPEEIDFSKDYEDFKKLSKDSQHFIKMILALTSAELGVNSFTINLILLMAIVVLLALPTFFLFKSSQGKSAVSKKT